MDHKDIIRSKESFEKFIADGNDQRNLGRYGTFGDPGIDSDRVLDSLVSDGYIDRVDYRPIGEAKRVVDEVVAEIGDHFLIYGEDDRCDMHLHLAYNLDTYIGRVTAQFSEVFEAFRGDPELLRAKMRERLFLKPRHFVQRALAADWTDLKTPVKVYVDSLCQRLRFSYTGEPQRAGVTLVMSWLMGKLVELGKLEFRDEDGESVVYLTDDEAAEWVLDEMLGWTNKKNKEAE